MADLKISALNSLAGADLVAADVVAVVDDSASETKKLTVSDLIANGVTLISNSTIPSAKILFSAGSVATASVADAGITTAKVADSSITAAKLADNSSVTLVSTLPGSGDFTGQVALDTDDSKIYVWSGSAWTSVKGAGSINVVNGSTSGIVNITTSTSGDTVTVSTTLDDTSSAAQFLAGPTGSGGTVGYRAIIGTDLPTASSSAKGGVIVNGNGLAMSGDTITVNNSVTAETSENHIVQYDANGLITGGRAIVAGDVPVATSSATGAVKPGSGLEVTGAGAINHSNSVSAATAAKVTFDAQGHITASEALAASDVPDLDASKITTGTLPTARLANDAVTADKLGDKSTTTIAETTPAGGTFIGQGHLNSISGDFLIWDGNVWQPIGVSVGEIVLAGTYNASTNKMATVTSEGTSLSYVVGSALPTASASNKGYYVVVSTAGTGTSPAPTVALNPPDFLLSTGTAYTEIDVSSTVIAQQASNVAFTAAGNISATNVQSAIEELDSEKVRSASPTFTGTVALGEDAVITFEGATDNAFETTLTVVDPTADRTVSLPNVTGTLISSGDTGSVTSAMIADGAIVNADINASAEIAVSKLANGTARQLLQTDVAGTGVEFTSNIDVPGTLDVTGAATLDSTLAVTGATTTSGVLNADGKVKYPAGTAGAPSLYSGTDTDTGIYSPGANQFGISTGGSSRFYIDASGNIGFSELTPVCRLDIVDTGGGQIANFSNGNDTDFVINCASGGVAEIGPATAGSLAIQTGDTERLRIDSSGNVGIGTSSPSAPLHVSQNAAQIALFQRPSGSSNVTVKSSASTTLKLDGTDSILAFVNAGGATPSYTIGRDNTDNTLRISQNSSAPGTNDLVTINSSGNVGIGTTSPSRILHVNSGATNEVARFESSDTEVTVEFKDPTGTASLKCRNDYRFNNSSGELIRIDSSGNVGIGETSPLSLLHVKSGDSGASAVESGSFLTVESNGNSAIQMLSGTSSNNYIYFGDSGDTNTGSIQYSHGANALIFRVNGGSERLRIDSSGRLLVGSTSNHGDEKLLIQGSASGSTGNSILTLRRGSDAGNGDGLGQVNFADTRTSSLYAQIFGVADAAPGANDFPGRLVFSTTADGASSPTERMRIDSSGNVGIAASGGQATYTDYAKAIVFGSSSETTLGFVLRTGTSGTSSIAFADNSGSGSGAQDGLIEYSQTNRALAFSTAASERLRIDSSGRLLIGTTVSRIVEDSAGNGPQGKIQIEATNSDAIMSIISASTVSAGRGGTLSLGRHRNTSVGGTPTVVQSGDDLGAICFAGGDGTDMRTTAAHIKVQVDGTPGSNDMPGRLILATTADGALYPTERLRITSTGAWAIEGASNYGTSGQVLTSNGNDSPTWQDAGGGGGAWNLVATINASDATTATFDGNIDNTYTQYAIVITNLVTTSSSMQDLRVRFVAGGSAITTAQYDSRGRGYFVNQASINEINENNASYGVLTNGGFRSDYTDAYAQGIVWMVGDRNSKAHGLRSEFNCTMYQDSSRNFKSYVHLIETSTARTVDGLQFFMDSGNLTGTFKLYGLS